MNEASIMVDSFKVSVKMQATILTGGGIIGGGTCIMPGTIGGRPLNDITIYCASQYVFLTLYI